MHKKPKTIYLALMMMLCLTGCAVIEKASGEAQTAVEISKPVFTNGCEWSSFIGLSEPTLATIEKAMKAPETSPDDKRLMRLDMERTALQDQNWLDNCGETTDKEMNAVSGD